MYAGDLCIGIKLVSSLGLGFLGEGKGSLV